MDDDVKTVADYKIVENGFIVMMVAKVSTLDLYLTFYFLFTAKCTVFFNSAVVDKSVQFEWQSVEMKDDFLHSKIVLPSSTNSIYELTLNDMLVFICIHLGQARKSSCSRGCQARRSGLARSHFASSS